MSTAKGSGAGRTRAQAYQNTHAFRHNKNSRKTNELRARVNTGGLCARCADKIEWRVKYRKYKALTQPRKCNACDERTVRHAYRTLCDGCAGARGVCPQCAENQRVNPKIPTKAEAAREREMLEGVVESMRERDRRTVYRKVSRGVDVMADLVDSDDDVDDVCEVKGSFNGDDSDDDNDNANGREMSSDAEGENCDGKKALSCPTSRASAAEATQVV
jgi:hypothetical protein